MGSILGSLLIDLFKSAIKRKIATAKQRREYNAFLTDIENWCNEFINKNETTVVATTAFSDYVNHYNLLEHLINFIEQPVNQTEESFITECNENAKTYLEERQVLTPDDIRCIKEFINSIFEKTKCFYEKMLPTNETAQYYKIGQTLAEFKKFGSDIQEIKECVVPQKATVIKKEYSCPTNTITRKFARYKDIQECNFLLQSEDMLDVCFKEKHVILLGEAGCGKTIALQQLAFMINATEYYPLIYNLNNYIDETIEQIIDETYQGVDYNKLFLIFDAYDEIQEKNRNDFARRINKFTLSNPDTIIIVSSRNNFYKFANDSGDGGLFNNFKEYGVLPITRFDIVNYIEANGVCSDSLYEEIREKELYDLVSTPFYLKELIEIFLKHNSLPSKADVMKEIIRNRFEDDSQKYITTKSMDDCEVELFDGLEKLAFAIQCMRAIKISNGDYQTIIKDKNQRKFISYSGVFAKESDGKWGFEHNNFREYLAAEYINQLTITEITNLICTSENKIFDSWLNVLSYLVLIRKEDDLLNYLVANDPEKIIRFERTRVDQETRDEIVIKELDDFAQKNIWISHGVNSTELIARFGQSPKVCEYLVKQIATSVNFRAQNNALSVLSKFTELYGMDEKIRNTLFYALKSDNVRCYEKQKILNAFASLGLGNDEITDYVVKSYNKNIDSNYRFGILKYLDKSDLYEKYIDIFVAEYELSEQHCDNDVSISYEVLDVFAKVKEAVAICKVIVSLGKHRDFYSHDDEKQSLVFSNAITMYKNGHKEVFDAIFEVLAESELHNHTFFKESINFFEKTGTKIDAFMKLVDFDIDVASYQTMPIISQFADESCYLFLLSKYQESPEKYGKFVERLTLYFGEDSVIYARYKEVLLQNGIELPERKPHFDLQKARHDGLQQYFNCLFDKKKYCELIRKMLQSMGKDCISFLELSMIDYFPIDFDDTSNIDEKYALQELYYRLVAIDKTNRDVYDTIMSISCWENFTITETCNILKRDSEIQISQSKKEIFENYCRKQLNDLNFQEEIKDTSKGNVSCTHRANNFLFLSEFFDFQYEKEVYLNMLFVPYFFFQSGDVQQSKFPSYVINKLSPNEFRDRVKHNLLEETMCTDALDMHIQFCKDNNLDWGVFSAIEMCQKKKTESWRKHRCIEYIEQVKGYEFLYSVFLETEDSDIIESIINTTQKYKDDRLKERLEYLNQKSEDKHIYLSTLISLNSKYAIQKYVEFTKETMQASNTPDNPWFDPTIEAISRVHKINLLDEINQLTKLVFSPNFQDNKKFELQNSLYRAYENLSKENYGLVLYELTTVVKSENISDEEKNFYNSLIIDIETINQAKSDVAWTIDEIRYFLEAHKV